MREEISEPQHWRSTAVAKASWSSRRRAVIRPLSAELVDAAFSDESSTTASRLDAPENEGPAHAVTDGITYPELIATLNNQLAQLETHRKQIQQLLDEAGERYS